LLNFLAKKTTRLLNSSTSCWRTWGSFVFW
jgi:hypothetical protein